MSISASGGGGGTTTPSPGVSPKQPLTGIGLYHPLRGRQACPEFNSFHQGVSKKNPRDGLLPCHPLPKRGQICDIPGPPSPPIVERLYLLEERVTYSNKQYPLATRHNAAHVDGHELVKNSSIWKIRLNELGDIAVPNPPLLQHSSLSQLSLQVISS